MKNKGFILLITLLVIGVIGLLILTSMQHILLYYKAINKQEESHRNFYHMESVALQLLHQHSFNPGCVVRTDAANAVIYDLLIQKGCSLTSDRIHYRYFIEDLGIFPCLTARFKGRKSATHHQRITIAPVEDGAYGPVLQIRFIQKGRIIPCLAKEHLISLGVSSWRYLPPE
ncbi:type II secretion system protein [Fluoribacter dumoffii]|uniref:type II secretion system protein n=1 Tax=Fluoribacter dumoffii TaxID=463 RepID=UPI0022433F7E|nr:type II secretion system protein [Fluoribacter dumoffii]MCW8385990.1 type II secretion system protein [Fluoribacter dumoffii]MCW8495715.1 type II secretion system protein [Fluoribacter dumoffii]